MFVVFDELANEFLAHARDSFEHRNKETEQSTKKRKEKENLKKCEVSFVPFQALVRCFASKPTIRSL